MKKLVIAVFAYNCEIQIKRVIKKIEENLSAINPKIIIIENNSTRDQTLNAAIEMAKITSKLDIEIYQNFKNYGLGGSHKVAINYARANNYEMLGIIHGDDQTNSLQLNEMLNLIDKNPLVAAVLGARFIKGAKLFGYDYKRWLANIFLTWLFTFLTFRRTYELGAGLSIHRVQYFDQVDYLTYTNDFNFYCYMLLDYYKQKSKLIFYPIEYYETDQISNVRNFKIGWLTLTCAFEWRFGILKKFTEIKDFSSKLVFSSRKN